MLEMGIVRGIPFFVVDAVEDSDEDVPGLVEEAGQHGVLVLLGPGATGLET